MNGLRASASLGARPDRTSVWGERLNVVSNLVADAVPITLSGELTQVAFRSGMSRAFWKLGLRVRSSNGRSVEVAAHEQFPTAYFAGVACQMVSANFMSTVQLLVREVVMSPHSAALLAPAPQSLE